MKNYFKSKKIFAFLLTMVMFTSLFFFTGCSDDEKLLFKIIYRPMASKSYELFGTYKEAIKDDVEFVAKEVIAHTVGAFGIGKLEHSYKDKEDNDKVKKKDLKPDVDEFYYSDLVGLNPYGSYYDDYVSKLIQCNNVIYLSSLRNTDDSGPSISRADAKVLVLSNADLSREIVEDMILFDEDAKSYVPRSSLIELSSEVRYNYNYSNPVYLPPNSIYYYEIGNDYSFIFIGNHLNNGDIQAYAYDRRNSFDGTYNAENYVRKILTTDYNNIQQTVTSVSVYDGAGHNIDSAKWKYSLTDAEMASVFSPQDYLNAYEYKYLQNFEVEIAKGILTRSESELNESLTLKYQAATRNNATGNDRQAFIDEASEYIDHFGLISEEVDSLTKFLLETAMGDNISYNNEKLENSCKKMLRELQEEIKFTPILEVLNYKASELEEIKIDGYIQSVMFVKEDNDYEFSDFICIFDMNNHPDNILPYQITVRHVSYGTINEYPIAVDEEDMLDGCITVSLSGATDNGKNYVELQPSEDPIKVNPLSLELVTREVKIIKRQEYAQKFIYSTSTKNTDGFAWCFNDDNCNYVQVTFGMNNLCINQHLDIETLGF